MITTSATAYALWLFSTSYLFEALFSVLVTAWAIGVATKFVRNLSFYDRI